MEGKMIKKGDVVYYVQHLEQVNMFEVLELIAHTVEDYWFAGIEKKEKKIYLLYKNDIGKHIFFNMNDALMSIKEAEINCNKNFKEENTYYY